MRKMRWDMTGAHTKTVYINHKNTYRIMKANDRYMFKLSVINFGGIDLKFDVNIVRRFLVLNNVPKCWVQIASCTTAHGMYESGTTTIYQSKTTKKCYMVRYFDGCFNKMYAEVVGVDWDALNKEMRSFWESIKPMWSDMLHSENNSEMGHMERYIRHNRLRNKGRDLLIKLVG